MFGIKRLKNQVFKLWCDNEVHKDLIASLRAEVSILKARLDRTDEEVRKCGTNLTETIGHVATKVYAAEKKTTSAPEAPKSKLNLRAVKVKKPAAKKAKV